MDKFSFGDFDKTKSPQDEVFSAEKGYTDPSNETDTRNQLSTPLTELKDYINSISTVRSSDSSQVVQLALDNSLKLKYRTGTNDAWKETRSSGHTIQDSNGQNVQQADYLRFEGATVSTSGNVTIVAGLKGDTGDTGPQGIPGYATINSSNYKGYFDTPEELPTTGVSAGDTAVATYTDTSMPHPIPIDQFYIYGPVNGTSTNAWHVVGQVMFGPDGEQGEQGDPGTSFTVKGLLESTDDLPASGSAGDVYAVGTESSNTLYIWDTTKNPDAWTNIGPLKGPKGDPGADVPGGGTTGQLLSKRSDDEYDFEWINPPIDVHYSASSTNAMSGGAVAEALQTLYPVGSLYVSSAKDGDTATSPNTTIGFGTWELIDKEFKVEEIKTGDTGFDPADYFTIDSTNIDSVTNFALRRRGREVRILMDLKVKRSNGLANGTVYSLGTFNLANLGISGLDTTAECGYYDSSSDARGNWVLASIVGETVDEAKVYTLKKLRSAGTIAVNNIIHVDFILNTTVTDGLPDITNAKCDKFVWRRTA